VLIPMLAVVAVRSPLSRPAQAVLPECSELIEIPVSAEAR
jgi:hypothetical protein